VKFRLALLAVACLSLGACSTMSKLWPFHKRVKPGPEAVNELSIVGPDGAAANYPQYWRRNALVIDLQGASGKGSIAARLPENTTWPVRVALRVRPGGVGQLEVQGEERVILPVTTAGTDPIDIELMPGVFRPQTAAIYISWDAQAPIAEDAPAAEPAKPEFVSPTDAPKVMAPVTAPAVPAPAPVDSTPIPETPAEGAAVPGMPASPSGTPVPETPPQSPPGT
jgi:hypothetical protein